MDKEILEILKTINGRFDGIEGRFDKIEGNFDKLEGRFDKIEGNFDKLESRFDKLEGKFDKLEKKVDKLEEGQKIIKVKLDNMTEDMTRELSNIAVKVSGVDAITSKNVHKIADLDMELTKIKALY